MLSLLTDRLEIHLDHIKMPASNGGVKTMGQSLDVLSAIKKSTVVVKAAFLLSSCINNCYGQSE